MISIDNIFGIPLPSLDVTKIPQLFNTNQKKNKGKGSTEPTLSWQESVSLKIKLLGQKFKKIGKTEETEETEEKFVYLRAPKRSELKKEKEAKTKKEIKNSLILLTQHADHLRKALFLLNVTEESDWRPDLTSLFKRLKRTRKQFKVMKLDLHNCLDLTCFFHNDTQREYIINADDSLGRLLKNLNGVIDYRWEEKQREILKTISNFSNDIMLLNKAVDEEFNIFNNATACIDVNLVPSIQDKHFHETYQNLTKSKGKKVLSDYDYTVFKRAFDYHKEQNRLNSILETMKVIEIWKQSKQRIITQMVVIDKLEDRNKQLTEELKRSKSLLEWILRGNIKQRIEKCSSSIVKEKRILQRWLVDLNKLYLRYPEDGWCPLESLDCYQTSYEEKQIQKEKERLIKLIDDKKMGMEHIISLRQSQKARAKVKKSIANRLAMMNTALRTIEGIFYRKIIAYRRELRQTANIEKSYSEKVFPNISIIKNELEQYKKTVNHVYALYESLIHTDKEGVKTKKTDEMLTLQDRILDKKFDLHIFQKGYRLIYSDL